MTTNIDTTIQTLFTKLAERKASVTALKAEMAKSWKTNGAFRLIGSSSTVNIQTAPVDVIEECLIHLNMFEHGRGKAAVQLGRAVNAKISGYAAQDWLNDFTKRLAAINIREEEKQLETLETRLNSVLSPEERRRIEVELLAKELENL